MRSRNAHEDPASAEHGKERAARSFWQSALRGDPNRCLPITPGRSEGDLEKDRVIRSVKSRGAREIRCRSEEPLGFNKPYALVMRRIEAAIRPAPISDLRISELKRGYPRNFGGRMEGSVARALRAPQQESSVSITRSVMRVKMARVM